MAKRKFKDDNLSPVDERVSPFQEHTLRPEQIGVDDLLINQYMPVLYQALYDIHSIYNATVENTLNNAALGAHQGLTPIQDAHQLGHHHICQILINTYSDDPHCCSETIPPVELIGE